MVGTRGFEPPTPRTPSVCATRLRYVPTEPESSIFYLRLSRCRATLVSVEPASQEKDHWLEIEQPWQLCYLFSLHFLKEKVRKGSLEAWFPPKLSWPRQW